VIKVIAYIRRHHVGLLALLFALGGTTAYAADRINGDDIVNRSIAGKKLRNNTVTGKQIKEKSLRCKWIHGCGKRGPKGPKGAKGATGPEGKQGPEGQVGPQGLIGPQGQAGTNGLLDPLLASRDALELEETATFNEWEVVPGAEGNGFDAATGVFTVPEDATYFIAIGADGGPVGPSEVSLDPSFGPYELSIVLNGVPFDQRSFPMIDIAAVLGLELRTALRDASAQLTEALPLKAGDELLFQIEANEIALESSFDADLLIGRLPG
jgi:hypothetical protein